MTAVRSIKNAHNENDFKLAVTLLSQMEVSHESTEY